MNDDTNHLLRDIDILSAVLSHNDPISVVQEYRICRLISNREAQLVLIDEDIKVLEERLQGLRKTRQMEYNRVKHYNAAFTRHRRLPTKLLSHIFECTVDRVNLPHKSTESPFSLMKVCRKWRHVATHTPALWTNLYFNCANASSGIEESILAMSGNLPLSIEIRRYASGFPEVPRFYPERCRNLVISGDYEPTIDLFRPHPAAFSSLQKLDITTRCLYESQSEDISLPFLATAANLRELTIDSIEGAALLKAITRLPVFDLTHLDISSSGSYTINCPLILTIMKRFTSLISCKIELSAYWDQPHPETILMPSLKFLDINAASSRSIDWITNFRMPSLIHIKFSGLRVPKGNAGYRSIVLHSKSLDILEVATEDERLGVYPPDLEQLFLPLAPAISQLIVHTTPPTLLSKSILDKLATGEFLPRLSKLECMASERIKMSAYLHMLDRRAYTSPAIMNITDVLIRHPKGLDFEMFVWSQLNRVRNKGVEVSFSQY